MLEEMPGSDGIYILPDAESPRHSYTSFHQKRFHLAPQTLRQSLTKAQPLHTRERISAYSQTLRQSLVLLSVKDDMKAVVIGNGLLWMSQTPPVFLPFYIVKEDVWTGDLACILGMTEK